MNQYRKMGKVKNVVAWANWNDIEKKTQGTSFLNTYDWIENQGGNVNEDQGEGSTALHYACRDGFNEVVKYLLNHNADINIQNDYGLPPIFFVGNFLDTPDTLKLMIERGADLRIVDHQGDNLLHQLVRMQSQECVKALLNLNLIDPFAVNNEGLSAIDVSRTYQLFHLFSVIEQSTLAQKGEGLPKSVKTRL